MEMDCRVDHANPYTNQIFQEAVIRNDVAVVRLLIKYGVQPKRNERNRQGLTALQQSVLDGNGKISIILLEAGADIEAKTSNGWTCLHIASALGDLDILTTMINHCADLIALTKNEELPIDLASTRDLKIKLAKEMTRVGYTELAQWYMRKLAAREGVFYVLSTDTLLDLACDDNYDKSYSTAYPYYLPQCNDETDMYVHAAPQNTSYWTRQGSELPRVPKTQNNMWLGVAEPENTTYLTCSSGYIAEAVLNNTSGEYTRVRNSTSVSSAGSPQRKNLPSISEGQVRQVPSISEELDVDNFRPSGGTLKRSKRNSQYMQRKQSKIELHIDYTNSTEDEPDEEDEDEIDHQSFIPQIIADDLCNSNTPTSSNSVGERTSSSNFSLGESVVTVNHRSPDSLELRSDQNLWQPCNSSPNDKNTRIEYNSPERDNKNRNVRFSNNDSSNEFCNCPNCKKMGYAFSPDIRASSRKMFHLGQQVIFSPDKGLPYNMVPASSYMHPQYYPATTTDKHALYFDGDNMYKPRKRKKKLFSGIKSIFKESIRVHRTTEHSPVVEDAGILFSVSLRERGKAKSIQQRQGVRKSNSFSGRSNDFVTEEVNVYPHNDVIKRPVTLSTNSSDTKENRRQNYEHDTSADDVFEATQWIECHHSDGRVERIHPSHRIRSNSEGFNKYTDTCDEHFHETQYQKNLDCKKVYYNNSGPHKIPPNDSNYPCVYDTKTTYLQGTI